MEGIFSPINIFACEQCHKVASGGEIPWTPEEARKAAQIHAVNTKHERATAYHVRSAEEYAIILGAIASLGCI